MLYFIDSCYASLATKSKDKVREIISACGANETIHSGVFPTALCNSLKLIPSIGVSIPVLHTMVVKELTGLTPIYAKAESDVLLEGPSSAIHLVPSDATSSSATAEFNAVMTRAPVAVVKLHFPSDFSEQETKMMVDALVEMATVVSDRVVVKFIESFKTNSTIIFMIIPLFLAYELLPLIDIEILSVVAPK